MQYILWIKWKLQTINQFLSVLIFYNVLWILDSAILLQDFSSWNFVLVFLLKTILQEFPQIL